MNGFPGGAIGAVRAFTPPTITTSAIGLVASVATGAVLQGAVMHQTVSDLASRPATFGDSVTTGLRFLLPLAGIGLVTAVGQGIGFVLLIVPGVILSLAWSVAAPAEVVEQTGVFGSIGRSVDLTRNHRGAIFALWVVYLAVQFAVQTAIRFALGIGIGATNLLTHDGIFGSFLITSTVYSLVERTLFGAVSAAGIASVYYELREIKDGVGAQQLAAVFD